MTILTTADILKSGFRKIVIANVFGSSNRGDAALVEVCAEQVRAVFPEAQISGIAYQPELARRHLANVTWFERPGNCPYSNHTLKRLCNIVRQAAIYAYVLFGRPSILRRVIPPSQVAALKEILAADLVVSCPGGYLQDSNLSYLACLTQLWLATKGRAKLVMAPQSVGPIRSRLAKLFLRHVLQKSLAICVREAESARFVQGLLADSATVVRTGDLAFWSPDVRDPNPPLCLELGLEPGQYIAATVVNWTFPLSTTPRLARCRYIEEMSRLFKRLHQHLGLKVFIVNQVSTDLPIAEAIVERCDNVGDRDFLVVDRKERSVTEIRQLINSARCFVGARFHSCIFALLGNVPTTAISYLPKTTGIMEDLGLSHRVVDIYGFSSATVAEMVLRDIRSPAEAKDEQSKAVKVYRERFPGLREVLVRLTPN